jgi:DNA polymerase-3 subunit alpha
LDIDISRIDLADSKTFELLQLAQTTAVFQLESRGMKDLIKRLKPSCFEDIIALVALFRPGPLQSGMVDDFINRKHGRQAVVYPHPDVEPILANTYGVILYQEQVMQIAQVLASYSLGEADLLRRAMGKKKPEEMAKQREKFVSGALARGVESETSGYIFDLMEKFAGYGFNKSHSAAYALVSYQTAWLKTHYPSAFMAAVLSADMQNTDKIVGLVEDCHRMGINVLPPCVSDGFYAFTQPSEKSIRYGLGAIKGLGEGPVEAIIEARNQKPFNSFEDFCHQVDFKKINKRSLEALILSGAFDAFGKRSVFFESLDDIVKQIEQGKANHSLGMMDLFANTDAPSTFQLQDRTDWSDEVRLKYEKQVLGFYLSGHPFLLYAQELKQYVSAISELKPTARGEKRTVAGLIVSIRSLKNKRGERLSVLTVDDCTSRMDVTIFSDLWEKNKHWLSQDQLLIAEGDVSLDDFSGGMRMRVRSLMGMTEFRLSKKVQLHCVLDLGSIQESDLDSFINDDLSMLQNQLKLNDDSHAESVASNMVDVFFHCQRSSFTAVMVLAPQWRIKPHDHIFAGIRQIPFVAKTHWVYPGDSAYQSSHGAKLV